MTIIYLGELNIDSSELADFLRGDDEHTVWFFTSAYQVHAWAEQDDDNIVVLFEPEFVDEAEKLKGRFVTLEKTGSDEEVIAAVEQAVHNLSTTQSIQ